jgi:hypothetical protein
MPLAKLCKTFGPRGLARPSNARSLDTPRAKLQRPACSNGAGLRGFTRPTLRLGRGAGMGQRGPPSAVRGWPSGPSKRASARAPASRGMHGTRQLRSRWGRSYSPGSAARLRPEEAVGARGGLGRLALGSRSRPLPTGPRRPRGSERGGGGGRPGKLCPGGSRGGGGVRHAGYGRRGATSPRQRGAGRPPCRRGAMSLRVSRDLGPAAHTSRPPCAGRNSRLSRPGRPGSAGACDGLLLFGASS